MTNNNKRQQKQLHSTYSTRTTTTTTTTTRFVFKINNKKQQRNKKYYFVLIGIVIIVVLSFVGMEHNQHNLNRYVYNTNQKHKHTIINKDVDDVDVVVGSSSSPSRSPSEVSTRIETITKELEAMASVTSVTSVTTTTTNTSNTKLSSSSSLYRYYMYDDKRITLPGIRQMALNDSVKPNKWIFSWGKRFISYSKHEIKMLQALERHNLRTYNPTEANFFIIPIPIGATFFWESNNQNESLVDAFRQILDTSSSNNNNNNNNNSYWFHKYPSRHVIGISLTENLFANWWGLSQIQLHRSFKESIIIRDSILTSMCDNKWMSYPCPNRFGIEESYFKNIVTVGFPPNIIISTSQEDDEEDIATTTTMEEVVKKWKNEKKYWIFYHSTELPSLYNSTIFRHALLHDEENFEHFMMKNEFWYRSSKDIYYITQNWTSTQDLIYQPISIGYDIPFDEWKSRYYNSKFCLVIRGDNPGSRALPTSINAGCIPIIVSDALPKYQPLFSKTLSYNDFAIMISENEFLINPVNSINKAISSFMMMSSFNNDSSSHNDSNLLYNKLEGLRLMKRILDPTRSDSLFVPALVKEIVETMG